MARDAGRVPVQRRTTYEHIAVFDPLDYDGLGDAAVLAAGLRRGEGVRGGGERG